MGLSEERKKEIINELMTIYNRFEPSIFNPDFHMFDLIVAYTNEFGNIERISGSWVVENAPEPLKSLPA